MHQCLVSCTALSLSVRSLVDLLACLFVVFVLWKVGYSSFLSLRLLADRPYTNRALWGRAATKTALSSTWALLLP